MQWSLMSFNVEEKWCKIDEFWCIYRYPTNVIKPKNLGTFRTGFSKSLTKVLHLSSVTPSTHVRTIYYHCDLLRFYCDFSPRDNHSIYCIFQITEIYCDFSESHCDFHPRACKIQVPVQLKNLEVLWLKYVCHTSKPVSMHTGIYEGLPKNQ